MVNLIRTRPNERKTSVELATEGKKEKQQEDQGKAGESYKPEILRMAEKDGIWK